MKNKIPAETTKKKSPPSKQSLFSRQKKTIKNKTILEDTPGKPTVFRGVVHDMTKLKRSEETGRKKAAKSIKQKVISPDETRGTLHELRVHQIEMEMQNEELRRAHVELDAARARYFSLYDLAPVGYCTVNDKGLILEANLTASTLLGITRGKLVNQILSRFILKQDQDIYYLHRKKLFDTGEPQTCDMRMVKKDGTQFWAHLVAAAANDEYGITVSRIVMSDITGIKRAEEKLRDEEQKFRALAEQSSDIIVLINRKGIITYENPAVEKCLGFKAEERIGANVFEHVHPDDLKLLTDSFNSFLSDTKAPVQKAEIRVCRKDGNWLMFEVVASGLSQENIVESVIINLRDITERKRAETQKKTAIEALRKSEKYFKEITENSSDILIITDKNGDLKYCSRSIERFTGYKPEELIGKSGFMFIHPDDVERAVKAYGKVLMANHTKLISNGFRIMHKDGSEVFLDGLARNLLDNPDIAGIVLNVRDITERKRIEEALRQSEEKYRTILENMQEGYFEVDLSGNFTFFNDSLCRIDGYPRDELMGMNYRHYTDKETSKIVFQAFNQVYKTGNPLEEIGMQIIRKDGVNRYVEASVSLLKDSSGKPTGFRGIVHDITERKQMEEALRHEQQFSKSVLDNLPGIFYLYTYPENRLVLWNKQHETLLGFKAEDIKDRLVTDWFAPENRDAVLKAIEVVMKKGQNFIEAPLVTKDGNQIPFFLPGIRFESDGRSYFMGVGMDITERKLAEEALRESEKRYWELSIIDDLTQLYNSRHFHDQLKKEIERSNRYEQPLTLLLLDLDKFKDFNDAYGHVEGDNVLSRLGQVIKRCLRDPDSAYRYGGEEFTIILPMTTKEEGFVIAKRVQEELRTEFFLPVLDQKVYITVSIGLSQYKSNEEIKAFVHRVDQLMYKVKKTQRGEICSDNGILR